MLLQMIQRTGDELHWFEDQVHLTRTLLNVELLLHSIGQRAIAANELRRVVQPQKMRHIPWIEEQIFVQLRFETSRRKESSRIRNQSAQALLIQSTYFIAEGKFNTVRQAMSVLMDAKIRVVFVKDS